MICRRPLRRGGDLAPSTERHRRRGAAGRHAIAVTGLALAVLAAGCSSGKAAAGPPRPASSTPSSPSATGSTAAKVKQCPARPLAAPRHSLALPRTVGGYQRIGGAFGPRRQFEMPPFGATVCKAPDVKASYKDSSGHFLDLYVGHHTSRWRTEHSFWGLFWSAGGMKPVPVPAGPLGGQAACGTNSQGTICDWLDSDTFGELVGEPDISPAQTAQAMLRFRAAAEHRI